MVRETNKHFSACLCYTCIDGHRVVMSRGIEIPFCIVCDCRACRSFSLFCAVCTKTEAHKHPPVVVHNARTDTNYFEVSVYGLHPSLVDARPKPPRSWTCELCGTIDDIGAYNRHPRSVEGAFQESVTLIICSRCDRDLDRKPTPVDWRTRIKVWHLMVGIPTLFALHQWLIW